MSGDEGFLRRWSRLKSAPAEERAEPLAEPAEPPPSREEGAIEPPAPTPPIESLTPEDMNKTVTSAVKRIRFHSRSSGSSRITRGTPAGRQRAGQADLGVGEGLHRDEDGGAGHGRDPTRVTEVVR